MDGRTRALPALSGPLLPTVARVSCEGGQYNAMLCGFWIGPESLDDRDDYHHHHRHHHQSCLPSSICIYISKEEEEEEEEQMNETVTL